MSGHTNRNKRNKRNGGNPPKRGPDGRSGQSSQSNQSSQSSQSKPTIGSSASGAEKQPRVEATAQSPAESAAPPAQPEPRESPAEVTPADELQVSAEPATPAEQAETPPPRGKTSFAAARGTHAYIPASGPRMAVNGAGGPNGNGRHNGHSGQNGSNEQGDQPAQQTQQTRPGQPGQNGYHRVHGSLNGNGHNGHAPMERGLEALAATNSASMDDDGEGDFSTPIPQTWRAERLNGGADATPREPFRPESRGDVGSLIDTLHDLFAQDRAVASRGDATRCGICYLHFPLADLEYREAEGFYVCSGCKRALGHQALMMIRRQQTPHNG